MPYGLPFYPDSPGPDETDPYAQELQAIQDQQFVPGQFSGRGSETFAGLENLDLPPARSLGQGLLFGALSGLGSAGTQVQKAREKFAEGEAARRAAFDSERRAATRELRQLRGSELRDTIKARRDEEKRQQEYERDNPIVTQDDVAANPGLGRLLGKRVPVSWLKPENPQQTIRDQRAADAAARAADAAERAANNSRLNNINKLSDDARADPDIKDFPAIRDSYNTGDEAAKRGNSAGDIILMRMIAKATDPTTGVREEEFKTFEGAQGTLARYGVRLTSSMWGGGQLTPQGRAELRSVLKGIFDRKSQAFSQAYDYHSGRAARFGFNPEDVVRDYRTAPGQVRHPNVPAPPLPSDDELRRAYEKRRKRGR